MTRGQHHCIADRLAKHLARHCARHDWLHGTGTGTWTPDRFPLGHLRVWRNSDEMLSGQRAFHGDTMIDAMTAIIKEDPPDLPTAERHIAPALARIVHRSWKESRGRGSKRRVIPLLRWRHFHHIRRPIVLPLALFQGVSGASASLGRWLRRSPWRPTAGAFRYFERTSVNSTRVSHLDSAAARRAPPLRRLALVPLPESLPFHQMVGVGAFAAIGADHRRLLWVRPLDALTAQPLAGTQDARAPLLVSARQPLSCLLRA